MTNITVTLTQEDAQYILNAVDTHIKTHGLGVAAGGVVIVSKIQAAANVSAPVDESESS